jgi:OmpA-OmpF porin, OOP family
MRNGSHVACLMLAVLLAGVLSPAVAQEDEYEALPSWYMGPLGGYVFPDAQRDAKGGTNGQLVIGFVAAEALSIELTGFYTQLTRDSDTSMHDYVSGGAVDLTLGTQAPGNPFFLLGVGAAEQDVLKVKKTDTFGELGLGLYLPFSMGGELWRLEGRYDVVFNNHPSLASEEMLEDVRVNLGVLFAFGRDAAPPPDEEESSAEAVAPAPVVPMNDQDNDGIPDEIDQCPGTPRWARADENGCVPDTDADGIDDSKDCCPATPSGSGVDAAGCEPPPRTNFAPPPDEDRDGVPDGTDACPHTKPRFDIDGKGCIKTEGLVVGNVHFDIDSSRLTNDGYQLLHMVAAALKAEPTMRLEVGGHADSTGPESHNNKLAMERATVVRDFLTYTGVSAERLAVKGYGETAPVAENDTGEGRAKNRRVQFRRLDE